MSQNDHKDDDESHVFIDTNVLLHYRALDGIRWSEFTESVIVYLHIAQPVLDEIAQKKDMGESKLLRKRAGQITKRFNEVLDAGSNRTELRTKEWLILEDETPVMTNYPGLNPASKDDQLLACLLNFKSVTSAKVFVATGDSSLAFRTKINRWNIKHKKIDDKHRLPEEVDADEVERRALERELVALKNAQPKLKLSFEGGETILQVIPNTCDVEEEVERITKRIKERYAPIKQSEVSPGKTGLEMIRSIGKVPGREAETYNAQLEPFYKAVRESFRNRLMRERQAFEINFVLENEGNVPAESVLVKLHFPDGFILVGKDKYDEQLPKYPKPPEKSRTLQETMNIVSHLNLPMNLPIARPDIGRYISHEGSISIKKTGSYDVTRDWPKIRQGSVVKFEPLWVFFDGEPAAFGIDYKIVADNMRGTLNGKLHFVVTS